MLNQSTSIGRRKMTNKTESDYIKLIETQSKKPIEEQLNDLKSAGAKLLVSLDKIITNLDTILEGFNQTNEQQSTPKEGQQSNTNRVDPW